MKKIVCMMVLSVTVGVAKEKIHPIVTSLGGIVLTTQEYSNQKWNPQDPDSDVIHAAAIHISAQQCPDGGFGWPHNDCSSTFHNITAPILNGVFKAWRRTKNAGYLGVMVDGGNFDLLSEYSNGDSRFSTETPLFMWNISKAVGDDTYTNFVESNVFGELEAATYGPNDLGTQAWIDSVVTARQGTWINLLPWEFKSLPLIAQKHCHPTQATIFEQAILDSFNSMDDTSPGSVYSDIIGVAGGVWGLAAINRQTFPAINAPLHSGISGMENLQQLVQFLIAQQNEDGSWYWHSNLSNPTEDDKDLQTTAYVVLALIKANEKISTDYLPIINSAQNWLESMQNPFGGFPSFPGGNENTEVEAEVLSALATVGVYDRLFANQFECYIN
jgi:hypothetical protein